MTLQYEARSDSVEAALFASFRLLHAALQLNGRRLLRGESFVHKVDRYARESTGQGPHDFINVWGTVGCPSDKQTRSSDDHALEGGCGVKSLHFFEKITRFHR